MSAIDQGLHSFQVTEEAIRERAYQLYEQRGGEDGNAEEDWYKAEAELRAEASLPKAA